MNKKNMLRINRLSSYSSCAKCYSSFFFRYTYDPIKPADSIASSVPTVILTTFTSR